MKCPKCSESPEMNQVALGFWICPRCRAEKSARRDWTKGELGILRRFLNSHDDKLDSRIFSLLPGRTRSAINAQVKRMRGGGSVVRKDKKPVPKAYFEDKEELDEILKYYSQ